MKQLILLIFFPFMALGFSPEREIDTVNMLENPEKIFKKLKGLKIENKNFQKTLLRQKSYRPMEFQYSLTLGVILDLLPKNLKDMEDCITLQNVLIHSYGVDWNNMPTPTHHIWPAFSKICEQK